MRLELVTRKDVSYVHIVKEDKSSLGISVKDGKSGFWPVIKRVKSGSLAERSHAVCEGDTLLSINGRNTLSMTRQQVKQLFKESPSSVFELKLEYEMHEASILHSGVYEQKTHNFTLKKENGTYGFILRKRGISYPFTVEFPVVSHVEYDGPACKEGSLMVGDKLLKIDNISLSWLSLREISVILHQRDEAEFFIDYKVAAINLPTAELNETELEICIPNVELGITLAFSPSYPSEIRVANIRKGSLGERCGAFSEGDIILAINGVDANCLTPSKANSLIHTFKKEPGKLLYRSNRWKRGEPGRASSDLLPRNSEIQSRLPRNASSSKERIDDFSSPNLKHKSEAKSGTDRLNNLNQDNKMESIQTFQIISQNITGIKSTLQKLYSSALKQNFENFPENRDSCDICKRTGNNVKVCYPCISNMNSSCCEVIDGIRNIAINYIGLSENKVTDFKRESLDSSNHCNFNRALLPTLASSLPKRFWDRTGLKNQYDVISESVLRLNSECKKCKDGITAASCLVQKLLLMISLNDNNSQVEAKIDQLIGVFSELKVPCGDCSEMSASSIETVSESFPKNNVTVPKVNARNMMKQVEKPEKMNNGENQRETHGQKSNLISNVQYKKSQLGLNLLEECVHFKPGASSSSTDRERSCTSDILNQTYSIEDNEHSGSISSGTSPQQKPWTHFPVNKNIKIPTKNSVEKIFKDKGLLHIPRRSWKSAESVLPLRHMQLNMIKTECSIDANPSCSRDTPRYTKTPQNSRSSPTNDFENGNSSVKTEQSNSTTFPSDNCAPNCFSLDFSSSATCNSASPSRVRQEIMNVKLTVDGNEGFGIGLGFMSTHSTIPVITSITAKSAAKRVGILNVYDRVLAINGRSIVGLTLRELETVREELAPLKQVTLTVEFDVNAIRMKFGVFDVHLKRNLIPGFLYEDASMGRGAPLRLKGIVKGSAAHRSGEVFVGDEILYLKCQREEEFNPISLDCSRCDSIIITIRRKLAQTGPRYSAVAQPLDDPISGVLRQGSSFQVLGTSVRLLDGQTVLEFRVRLFRDPKHWDFGFLVGEKQGADRAYVTDVREGGPAHDSGVVKKSDRIIEVDGVLIGNNTDASALSLLTQANERVDLLLRRIHRGGANGTSESSHA